MADSVGRIALLLALLLLGVPIFVAFLMLNVTGMLLLIGPAGFGMITNSIYTTSTLGALAAVPLFILMGELLFRSGAMDVLFDSARPADRQGSRAAICALHPAFGYYRRAVRGRMAVAGLLGRSLFPTMRKRGYDLHLSAGASLAGQAWTRSSRQASWRSSLPLSPRYRRKKC